MARGTTGRAVATAALVLFVGLAAAPAPAPTPRRSNLLDLAYVLGEIHALRQLCARSDQTWRNRMKQMLDVEAVDPTLSRELAEHFNSGFRARRAQFNGCGPRVTTAEIETRDRGRRLALALAR